MTAALFSPDLIYRYALMRRIPVTRGQDRGVLNVIMLNPSTATAETDDPTIRRCIRFAQDLGYSRLVVTNLFAFRATDPTALRAAADPVGPLNDEIIVLHANLADRIIAAWGTHGDFLGRADHVLGRLTILGILSDCWGMTKDGHPKHPLYLAADTKPEPYEVRP